MFVRRQTASCKSRWISALICWKTAALFFIIHFSDISFLNPFFFFIQRSFAKITIFYSFSQVLNFLTNKKFFPKIKCNVMFIPLDKVLVFSVYLSLFNYVQKPTLFITMRWLCNFQTTHRYHRRTPIFVCMYMYEHGILQMEHAFRHRRQRKGPKEDWR